MKCIYVSFTVSNSLYNYSSSKKKQYFHILKAVHSPVKGKKNRYDPKLTMQPMILIIRPAKWLVATLMRAMVSCKFGTPVTS